MTVKVKDPLINFNSILSEINLSTKQVDENILILNIDNCHWPTGTSSEAANERNQFQISWISAGLLKLKIQLQIISH